MNTTLPAWRFDTPDACRVSALQAFACEGELRERLGAHPGDASLLGAVERCAQAHLKAVRRLCRFARGDQPLDEVPVREAVRQVLSREIDSNGGYCRGWDLVAAVRILGSPAPETEVYAAARELGYATRFRKHDGGPRQFRAWVKV